MSYDDILMLKETLQIIDQGCYEHEGKEVKLDSRVSMISVNK